MKNTKPWWQSKTIWGAIIALLAGAGSLAGLKLDALLQDQLADLLVGAADISAGVLSWIGRVKAVNKIGWGRN